MMESEKGGRATVGGGQSLAVRAQCHSVRVGCHFHVGAMWRYQAAVRQHSVASGIALHGPVAGWCLQFGLPGPLAASLKQRSTT